jgi:hypothetical protein
MKFKHSYDDQRFAALCEPLRYLLLDLDMFFIENGHELVITCTWTTREEDMKVGRKELGHREYRAADARSKDLPVEFKTRVIAEFAKRYKGWGAISRSDGVERLIQVRSIGTDNEHFHIQLKKDWKAIKLGDKNDRADQVIH